MRYAICNETFEGWNWEETCRFVAEVGFDAIEIAPFTLAGDVRDIGPDERRSIRSTAERQGLTIAGLHWLLVSPEGLSLTADDAEVRRATSTYLTALTDFCADVGGTVMVLGSPKQRRIPSGQTPSAALSRFLDSIRPALDVARDRGVRLCLEPLPPPEADLLLTLREAAEALQLLDHPAACTILDIKSASADEAPIPELVRRHAHHIGHVHANDANRRAPGYGQTDFVPILAALKQAGYDGLVSVEAFDYSPDPRTLARDSLRYLRACEAQASAV